MCTANASSNSLIAVVFPQVHYRKAPSAKLAGYATVSFSVVRDFLIPPCSVVFWGGITAGAPMPKTSIDKDRQLKLRNHQVWRPRQRSYIALKSDLFGAHYIAYATFDTCSPRADTLHVF